MSPVWTFRERRIDDLRRCVEILRDTHLAENYPVHWPNDPASWLSPDHFLQSWIAEDETGSLGGHIALIEASATEARVERLFVARAATGSGVGRRLLELSLDRADKDGLRVSLEVADNCTAAIDLYRRIGWTETGKVAIEWGAGNPHELLTFAAPHSPLVVEPAGPDDVEQLRDMRDSAARWQQARGLHQWVPGELTPDELRRQIDGGSVHVVRDGGRVAASIRLLWADPEIWGHDNADSAGYIHGLMTRDRGTGLGSRLLRWAEHRMTDNGRTVSRLDCVASNAKLREFYRGRGYSEVGSHSFADPRWSPVTTFEKALSTERA